jgi:hypothetical protein
MALLKIDWKPSDAKVREFGRNLIVFAAVLALLALAKGRREKAAWLLGAGAALGALVWTLPGSAGRLVYRAWMSAAFVVGTCVSTAGLVVLYYGVVTPLGLLLRLRGRDALGLGGQDQDSYWINLPPPPEKSSWERLY